MRYVIVGASAAGAQAAEDIRKLDPEGDIRLIGAEPHPPYSRCLISRFVDGRLSEEHLFFKTRRFAETWKIETTIGTKVAQIDRANKTVTCENGDRYTFDKLLLATGSRPWTPRLEGIERQGVSTFHGMADARALAARAKDATSAVVIGAGFVGLEAAYALARLGLKVTVVERCPQILPNQLDARGAGIIHADLEAMGVEIILDESVSSIDGNGSVTGVTVAEKPHVQADLVIVATGIEPNKELAVEAGLDTDRGVVVDEYLQTSDPNIFAAGDVIEVSDVSTGKRVPSATWFNAVLQGKYAAYNMTGHRRRYTGAVGIQNAVQFHQIPAISFGQTLVESDSHEDHEVLSMREGDKVYKKLVLKGNHIVGMIFVGDIQKSGFYNALIRHQVDVSAHRSKLLDPDFSYAAFHATEQFGQRTPYVVKVKG